MTAKIYTLHPRKSSDAYVRRDDIYLRTGTDPEPVFVKVNGWWVLFDPNNEEHISKMKLIEGKVIPFPGNKK